MRVLELKVPPLAVGVLVAGLMWLVSWAVPALDFVIPGRELLALIFALAGAIIIVVGVVSFRRAKTTINPMKPDRHRRWCFRAYTSSAAIQCI